MSSAFSIFPGSLLRERIDERRALPCLKSTRSLHEQLARIVGDLSDELDADLEAALADGAGGPFRRGALVTKLFRTAFPVQAGGVPALQPMFAAEAVSRAQTMLGLVVLLEERSWHGREPWYPDVSPLTLHRELALASSILSFFEVLAEESGCEPSPCGEILTGVLSGFVELFSPGIGHLSLELDAEPVDLPGFKRQALVLAAADLINHTMLYGLRRPHSGRLRATLRKVANGRAQFTLEHDGTNVELAHPREAVGALSTMAALLNADLSCCRSVMGGAATAFHFPC
jgi:hypothetical protein